MCSAKVLDNFVSIFCEAEAKKVHSLSAFVQNYTTDRISQFFRIYDIILEYFNFMQVDSILCLRLNERFPIKFCSWPDGLVDFSCNAEIIENQQQKIVDQKAR